MSSNQSRLLVLHQHLSRSDYTIAEVASRLGWNLVRLTNDRPEGWEKLAAAERIRHYGNTATRTFSRRRLPIRFCEIDPAILGSIPWATNREITLTRLSDLVQPLSEPTFVKPVQGKWFKSRVYMAGEVVEPSCDQLGSDDPRDRIVYTAKPTRFLNEVRCWCLNGKILTSCPYRYGHIRADQLPLAKPVADLYRRCPTLPRAVVADFGLNATGEWSLIELNKPWASDLYQADPDRCFDCIVESQEDADPAAG